MGCKSSTWLQLVSIMKKSFCKEYCGRTNTANTVVGILLEKDRPHTTVSSKLFSKINLEIKCIYTQKTLRKHTCHNLVQCKALFMVCC